MRVSVRSDVRDYEADSARLVQEARRAAVRASNAIAGEISEGMREVLERDLDRPTDKTLDAFTTVDARGTAGSAAVVLRHEQAEYLWKVFYGGVERDVVVPFRNSKMDRHGNFPRGYLASVEASGGFWKTTDSGVRTLFQRDGMGGLEAVAFRAERVNYRPIIDLEEEIRSIHDEVAEEQASKAFDKVFRSDGK